MIQEHKELLLKDICCRLPYGVILKCADLVGEELRTITKEGLINNDYDIDEVKPCLFPLSIMTEEQKKEYAHVLVMSSNIFYAQLTDTFIEDWFNKNHFDYRGLIEKGFAIDATNLNIY